MWSWVIDIKKEILITDEIIRSDYTDSRPGIYCTLTLPMKIGPNFFKDQLIIGLNTNLTYAVYIHDAEYFLMNANPTSTPSIYRKFTTSAEKTTSWFYKLSLVEVNKLNLPRSPCVEDPSYSFFIVCEWKYSFKGARKQYFSLSCDKI